MSGSGSVEQKFAEAVEHHNAGRFRDAEFGYRQILTLEPGHVGALNALGVLAYQAGRNDAAAELIGRAVRFSPDFAEAHSNLGAALNGLGRFDDAARAFGAAIHLKPDYVDAHYNLATALANLQRMDEAVSAYKTAIRLKPDYADAHANLGAVLEKLGRFDEAVVPLNAAIRLNPGNAGTYCNLGVVLTHLGRFDEAMAALRTALRLKPDLAGAHHQEAIVRLLHGDLAAAWPKFEWRWHMGNNILPSRHFAQPQWQGEDIAGRSILLHSEQGLGDTIQFARYAPMLAARGAKVILTAERRLLRLLAGLPGVDQLVAFGDPLPAFDYHCPLLSLPGAFGTTLETIPAEMPYLRAEGELVEKWRARIGTENFKIGIAWQGNPSNPMDRGRSIPLACFTHLAQMPDVRLISLQKGPGLEQLDLLPAGMRVETLGPDFDSGQDAFLDTAAAMTVLDLIVTSDTSICHLAGALNRPVWVALKTVPHWVFMLDRQDSPWYPSMRLFRQTEPGNWDDVFRRMAAELAQQMERVGCRKAGRSA